MKPTDEELIFYRLRHTRLCDVQEIIAVGDRVLLMSDYECNLRIRLRPLNMIVYGYVSEIHDSHVRICWPCTGDLGGNFFQRFQWANPYVIYCDRDPDVEEIS